MAKLIRRQIDFSTVRPVDWAYLAGIIDGEGCISIRHNTGRNKGIGRYSLVVHVANTDTRLITWLRATVGGYAQYSRPVKVTHRPAWVWRCQATRAEEILKNCMIYLIAKKDQAEVALSFCETLRMVRACRSGVPEHIIDMRKGYKKQLEALKTRTFPPVEGVKSKYLQ